MSAEIPQNYQDHDADLSDEDISQEETGLKLPTENEYLVHKYYDMVFSIAREVAILNHITDPHQFEDLVGAGFVGLVYAAAKFKPEKMSPEASTGSHYFYQAIDRAIGKGLAKFFGSKTVSSEKNGKAVNKQVIMRLKPSVILGTASSTAQPLDPSNPKRTLDDILPVPQTHRSVYDHVIESIDLSNALEIYFNGLDAAKRERAREIHTRSFAKNQTQKQIGQALGTSHTYVGDRLKRELGALREILGEDYEQAA